MTMQRPRPGQEKKDKGGLVLIGLLGLGGLGALLLGRRRAGGANGGNGGGDGTFPPGTGIVDSFTQNTDGTLTVTFTDGSVWICDAAAGSPVVGQTYTCVPPGGATSPTLPPLPANFRNITFQFTSDYLGALNDPRVANLKIPVNQPGRVVMSVSGEYRGESAWVQARQGAADPLFGSLESASIETLVGGDPNVYLPFGPITTGGLGWQANEFPEGDSFQLLGRLVGTDGRTNISGDMSTAQATVSIIAPIWGQIEIMGPMEVIDRTGRHVSTGFITVDQVGDFVVFIISVRNNDPEISAEIIIEHYCRSISTLGRSTIDPATFKAEVFAFEPSGSGEIFVEHVMTETCFSTFSTTRHATGTARSLGISAAQQLAGERAHPSLLNPQNFPVTVTGQGALL